MPRVASFDEIGVLGSALGAATRRHEVITDNLSNVNTPGFRRAEVQFEEILSRALHGPQPLDLRRTDSRHLSARGSVRLDEVSPRVIVEVDTYARNDRSNVNPEIENIEMAKNSMWAQALSTRLRQKLQQVREVIQRSAGA